MKVLRFLRPLGLIVTVERTNNKNHGPVSTRTAVLQTLSARGPMRARDIVHEVTAREDVILNGKTPRKSIEARLAEMHGRGELDRVGRGMYQISDDQDQPLRRDHNARAKVKV